MIILGIRNGVPIGPQVTYHFLITDIYEIDFQPILCVLIYLHNQHICRLLVLGSTCTLEALVSFYFILRKTMATLLSTSLKMVTFNQ